MKKNQKQTYLYTLSGIFIVVLATIIAMVVAIVTINIASSWPEAIVSIFLAFPSLIVISSCVFTCYIPIMYSIPIVYKSVQKTSGIIFILVGVVGFFTMLANIVITALIIDPEFHDTFNPFSHYLSIFYLGPLLIVIGGILSLLDVRKSDLSRGKGNDVEKDNRSRSTFKVIWKYKCCQEY